MGDKSKKNLVDRSELKAANFDLDTEPEKAPAKPAGKPADRRRQPRMSVGMVIRASLKDMQEVISGYTINVSTGGLFIRTSKPPPVGTRLRFEIKLKDGTPILNGSGEVTWKRDPSPPGQKPCLPGVGIKFLELDKNSQHFVRAMVQRSQEQLKAACPPAQEEQKETTEEVLDLDEVAEEEGQPEMDAERLAAIDQLLGGIPLEPPKPLPPPDQPSVSLPEDEGELRKLVANTLTTALELSEAREHIDVDTVRHLLFNWFKDYYSDGCVNLGLLWDTLIAEEAITMEQAALPVAIFRITCADYGLKAELPETVLSFGKYQEIESEAHYMNLSAGTFERILEKVSSRPMPDLPPEIAQMEYERQKAAPVASQAKTDKKPWLSPKTRKVLAWVGFPLAIAALTLSLYTLRTIQATHYSVKDLRAVLQLKDGSRAGSSLTAVIVDPRWENLPDNQRRELVRKLAQSVSQDGISTMTLFDQSLMVVATIQPGKDQAAQPVIRVGEDAE